MTGEKKEPEKPGRGADPLSRGPGKLEEGRDYYFDPETGLCVMTEDYLRRRGTCCWNGCRHCPYGSATTPDAD